MTDYIEKQFREITSRNPIAGNDFAGGLKDFKFSVGQGYGFIPSQSYFRIELEVLNRAGGVAEAPNNAADLVFADGVCGNLFNNIYFNIGGQTVSSITTGLPQCDMLKNRLTKSSAYNKTIGLTQGFQPHFLDRQNTLSTNGADAGHNLNSRGKNRRFFIWQPSIGIFDVPDPLGAGEYDIQLNPSQNFATSAVQSGGAAGLVVGALDGNYQFVVHGMRFYACIVRTNVPATGDEKIQLMEMSVHTANNATGAAVEINEEVSVPSSTRAITMFIQDQQAGVDTRIPPSLFKENNNDELTLRNYQIQYGNLTKPTVRYDSNFGAAINTLHQRYIGNALETGQYFNESGFETFEEYLERGCYVHESFIKSADNLATRAQITASYGNLEDPTRTFIIAHYSKSVVISRTNGIVTNVTTQNI